MIEVHGPPGNRFPLQTSLALDRFPAYFAEPDHMDGYACHGTAFVVDYHPAYGLWPCQLNFEWRHFGSDDDVNRADCATVRGGKQFQLIPFRDPVRELGWDFQEEITLHVGLSLSQHLVVAAPRSPRTRPLAMRAT